MRRLVSCLAMIGMVAFIPAAIVLGFVALQMQELSGQVQPQPQSLRLAELIEKGPGDNAHVELTGFKFDKPIFEARNGRWFAVWIALYPADNKIHGETPAVLLRTNRVHDQRQLDELLKQTQLTALVGSALPVSQWKAAPAAALYTPYPKLDPNKTIVLCDPALIIHGRTILTAAELFDAQTPMRAWGVAAAALALGGLCLLVWHRLGSLPKRRRRPSPWRPMPASNPRIAELKAISSHRFTVRPARRRLLVRAGGALVLLAVSAGMFAVAYLAFREGRANVAALAGVAGGFVLFCLASSLLNVAAEFLFPISIVDLYSAGIRWQRFGRSHVAPWQDIDDIYRRDLEMEGRASASEAGGLCLVLRSGKRLRFSDDTLTNFSTFVDVIQRMHGRLELQRKQDEMAEEGVAWFGDIGVKSTGLSLGGRTIRWSEVERVKITGGNLNLYLSGSRWRNRKSYPLKDIPNYEVLLTMLQPESNLESLHKTLQMAQ